MIGIICGQCGGQIGPSDYFKLRDEVWQAAGLSGIRCKKCTDAALGHPINCADLDPAFPWWGREVSQRYFDGIIDAIAGRTLEEEEGMYVAGFGLGKMFGNASTEEQRRQFLTGKGQPTAQETLASFEPLCPPMPQRGLRDVPRGPGTGRP